MKEKVFLKEKDALTFDYEMVRDLLNGRRREVEDEQEALNEKAQMLDAMEKAMEMYSSLNDECERLREQQENGNEEIDRLMAEIKALKDEAKSLKDQLNNKDMQILELGNMAKSMAKGADDDVVVALLRKYMNVSRRKTVKKRGYIKMAVQEITQIANISLPEEMLRELERFDDDDPSVKVNGDMNVMGDYVKDQVNISNKD